MPLIVEKALCINHPDSEGRMLTMHKRFQHQKLKVDLSPGLDPPLGKPAFIGCLLAHQRAVTTAFNEGAANVAVFEDDIIFLQSWPAILKQLQDVPEDFDIVRLSIITDGLYRRVHVAGNVFRCWEAYGTQAYVLNRKAFEKVLHFPLTDPYDEQLGSADLIQYALHPLPIYHELGTSTLGNIWMQVRDDYPGQALSRNEAADILDAFLRDKKFSFNAQLRIMQGLSVLREGAHTQEIRFLKRLLEPMEMSRQEAIDISRALFTLSVEEQSPTPIQKD